MAATYTLSTTTLTFGVGVSDDRVTVASTANITPGQCLYLDQECMSVLAIPSSTVAVVKRGRFGTASSPHSSSATVYIANPDQLYETNPMGAPLSAVLVQPWINILTGGIWYPYGDEVPDGQTARWWQLQSVTYGVGSLGVRTMTTVSSQ